MSGAPADLTWRPAELADAAALVRLIGEIERVDRTGVRVSVADIESELSLPGLTLDTDTLVADADDRLVAFGAVYAPPTVRDRFEPHADAGVDPAWRRKGLGRRILGWQLDRATRMARDRHPDLPARLLGQAHHRDAGRARLLGHAGFQPVRWFSRMSRGLATPVGEVPVPDGYSLVPWDPDRGEATRLAHNEAFAEHWGSVPRDERMWEHLVTGPAFRSDLSYLAIRDNRVAGYALSAESTQDESGDRAVTLSYLGTRPEHRGRGLGAALLNQAVAAYRAAGYTTAQLYVDTENDTGALGLYERTGFTVTLRTVTYARDLPGILE